MQTRWKKQWLSNLQLSGSWSPGFNSHNKQPGQKKKKKSHTVIFRWTAFSFDYGTHSPWHCFVKLMQCHNIYLSAAHCISSGSITCYHLKHINHCSNYPVEGSYLFAQLNPGGDLCFLARWCVLFWWKKERKNEWMNEISVYLVIKICALFNDL